MNTQMNRPVLQLNASYEPLRIIPVRHALKLIVKGKAEIEVAREGECHPGLRYPSVVRLSRFRHVPSSRVQPHRRNIYLRDDHRCQYCGEKFAAKDLTLDHVLPKAQGGRDTWENLVACCEPCNRGKADRTPEQADMPLLRRPLPRNVHTSRHMLRLNAAEEPGWSKFLYIN